MKLVNGQTALLAARTAWASPAPRHYVPWTKERVADLQRLWKDGLSAAQIAKQIGGTRNAIIGKAHRLGLTTDTRKNPTDPKAVARSRRTTKPKLKIVNRAVMHEAEPRAPRVTTPFPEAPGGLRITDPGFGGCRWPLNGEGADIRFCAAPVDEGCSYCSEHFKRAVQPPVPGKKRSANEFARSLRRYMG